MYLPIRYSEEPINLTSLKKRMSKKEESVGGPIDVAVISKGDGLIWIKRKHYFKPELNPQYFTKYLREMLPLLGRNDEENKEKGNLDSQS
jgi:hypothetical protein